MPPTSHDGVQQTTGGHSSGEGVVGEKYPHDPVSSATASLMLTVVQVGILPVLTSVGVTLNVINMAVFLRQGLSEDRINLCLFSLAVSDTGYISLSLISRLYSIFSLISPPLAAFWKVQSLNLVGIYAGFLSTSNCLTLLISLERGLCVLWPLKAKNLLSVRRMSVVIFFIFLTCLCCCGLVCFKYYTLSYRDPQTNATVYYNQPTWFYTHNRLIVDVIFDTICNMTLPAVCLFGVTMATVLISLRMRAVLSWRSKAAHVGSDVTVTSSERRENLLTRMLLVVCVMFSVCTIPAVTQSFGRFSVRDFEPGRRYNNIFYVTITLTHTMATINSSGNFLIYYTMSTKFKDTLRSLFTGKDPNPQSRFTGKDPNVPPEKLRT